MVHVGFYDVAVKLSRCPIGPSRQVHSDIVQPDICH